MPVGLEEHIAILERERRALEVLLAEDPDWQGLADLAAREAKGEMLDAALVALQRVRYERSLASNPVFRARERLLEAMALLLDAAANAPGPALPPPLPPVVPAGLQLTRIRGIDEDRAAQLAAIGVTSAADVACWTSADVRRVAKALGLGRDISQQNWIEQAALLCAAATPAAASPPAPAAPPVPEAERAAVPKSESPVGANVGALVASTARRVLEHAAPPEASQAVEQPEHGEPAEHPQIVASEAAEGGDASDDPPAAHEEAMESVSGEPPAHDFLAASLADAAAAIAEHLARLERETDVLTLTPVLADTAGPDSAIERTAPPAPDDPSEPAGLETPQAPPPLPPRHFLHRDRIEPGDYDAYRLIAEEASVMIVRRDRDAGPGTDASAPAPGSEDAVPDVVPKPAPVVSRFRPER